MQNWKVFGQDFKWSPGSAPHVWKLKKKNAEIKNTTSTPLESHIILSASRWPYNCKKGHWSACSYAKFTYWSSLTTCRSIWKWDFIKDKNLQNIFEPQDWIFSHLKKKQTEGYQEINLSKPKMWFGFSTTF
jgi:hypothetical protein